MLIVINGSEFETLATLHSYLTWTDGERNEPNKDKSWYILYQKQDNLLEWALFLLYVELYVNETKVAQWDGFK